MASGTRIAPEDRQEESLMPNPSFWRLLVSGSVWLFFVLIIGVQTSKADPMTFQLSAGGSGECCPSSFATLTGTFEFDPLAVTIFNVDLTATERIAYIGEDENGQIDTFTEFWYFGPVSGTPDGSGDEIFSFDGYVGTLGDILSFEVVMDSEVHGFVPTGITSGITGAGPMSPLSMIGVWGGQITPVPEPTSFSLLAATLGCILIVAYSQRASRPRAESGNFGLKKI